MKVQMLSAPWVRGSVTNNHKASLQLAFLVLLVAGCNAATPSDERPGGGATAGTFAATAGTFGGTAGMFGGTAGVSGGMAGVNGGGTAGVSGGTQGRPTSGSTAMPCNVNDILKHNCQSCHAATPLANVPMALVSWEDTQQPSVSDPTMTVAQLMKLRTHDTFKPMPPPPSAMLGADTLAVLDAWIDGGAIAGTDPSCAPKMYGGVMPPDVENCYEVRVHPNGDKNSKLNVSGENYGTFYFDAPWPAGSQGVYFETLDGGTPEILHHWLVYAEENASNADGTVTYPTTGSHPSAPTLIAGWAPGSNNNDIPSNVGLMLDGANRKMSLEFHFYGTTATVPTNAGVKICTVEKNLRPNSATVSWLGTEAIFLSPGAPGKASGVCTPQNQTEDINIVRMWPHMHLTGRSMESTVVRKDGTREAISPQGGWEFDFNSEVSWPTPITVHPGDKIETVCNFMNDTNRLISVGYDNASEMCFNFTIAYPAKKLISTNSGGSLTGSSTACLQ